MGMEWFIILLIWLVAPFAELAAIIVLAVANSRYKRRIWELTRGTGKADTGMQDKGPADIEIQHERPADIKMQHEGPADTEIQYERPADIEIQREKPADIKIQHEGPADTEIQHERPADAVTQHEKSAAWYGPGQAIVVPEDFEKAESACRVPEIPHKQTALVRAPKIDGGFFQGTAALVIGVIFVVLAGLIFATTAWHVLPSVCKVIMVLGGSGLFFGASWAAEKYFKIERTGQAFYILGSVFLFLTILAAGYFGLLGPEFILKGENRYRVLLAGSIATEIALFSKIRRFHNKVYTQACLWGMTVSMCFLMGALKLEWPDCMNGMMYYSFLLIGGNEVYRRKSGLQGSMNAPADRFIDEFMGEFGLFAALQFWIISGMMAYKAVAGGIGFIIGILFLGIWEVTFWDTLAFGLMAAGTALVALRRRSPEMKMLHSLTMMIFFQYAGFCIPVDFTYQVFLGAAMTAVWFLAERRFKNPLNNLAGGCVFSAVLAIDMAVLLLDMLFSRDSLGNQLAASAVVILLAAVMAEWGRRYPVLRGSVAAVLFALTLTGWEVFNRTLGMDVGYDVVVWGYVLIVSIWDMVKKDRFCIPILAIGTAAQALARLENQETLSFFLLLSVYLLVKSFGREGTARERFIRGSCLYSLAGVYLLAEGATANGVLRMVWTAAVYGLEYASVILHDRSKIRDRFWNCTGMTVFLMMMGAFYSDPSLALWNMILCMAVFAVIYVMLYRSGCSWLHLAAAAAVLPLPMIATARYGLNENQVYGATAALLILSGILFRRFRPVMVRREGESGGWDVDWFHILVIFVLIPMAWEAGRGWQCAYILLTALYVLQFAVLEHWKRAAFTLAAALAAAAFWRQPFIRWPEMLSLEIQLIPAAGFIWSLGRIWGDRKEITNLQTVLYCLCLGAMASDALSTGAVWDALILEAVNLAVFLLAHMRKCMRWIRISGIIMILVALYMTKDFWLSLSWWVYLLAAGLGLIVFAAVNEMKKR